MSIATNIRSVNRRIAVVCKKAKREHKDIKVVAASKYATVKEIKEAHAAGICVFGENKVQDLLQKQQELCNLPVEWHFIGHLQTNKVKKVIGRVALIHSVDSLKLAFKINKKASESKQIQSILMQVNISGEKSKYGFGLKNSLQAAKEIAKLESTQLRGLMTIAPYVAENTLLETHFIKSRELFELIKEEVGECFNQLSMGMSNDFEIAVEHGANLLRLGSSIFK